MKMNANSSRKSGNEALQGWLKAIAWKSFSAAVSGFARTTKKADHCKGSRKSMQMASFMPAVRLIAKTLWQPVKNSKPCSESDDSLQMVTLGPAINPKPKKVSNSKEKKNTTNSNESVSICHFIAEMIKNVWMKVSSIKKKTTLDEV